ncbi:MAG: hypothetical protein ACRDO1_10325 [Nocardioidaceae bacterium]
MDAFVDAYTAGDAEVVCAALTEEMADVTRRETTRRTNDDPCFETCVDAIGHQIQEGFRGASDDEEGYHDAKPTMDSEFEADVYVLFKGDHLEEEEFELDVSTESG